MSDLFGAQKTTAESYTAQDIEVLEGLEPVRRRPGMYIGGTDERALHHLFAEVLDNAMDEAVAGHASRIEVHLDADGTVTVQDNGRGIPIDPHPKFPDKSALEVILTTLHSGGKFEGKVYATAGGLHGVGISVVNALSQSLVVEVARDRTAYRQRFAQGHPEGPLEHLGKVHNRRGTTVRFLPDPAIFGKEARLKPSRLFRMSRAKAYLYRGVEIRWSCEASLLQGEDQTPAEAVLHYPGGLNDFLSSHLGDQPLLGDGLFSGTADFADGQGRVEWAIAWPDRSILAGDGMLTSYCNTIPTPQGGTHEAGMRMALTRGLKGFADLTGNKKGGQITGDDITGGMAAVLSVFIRDPQFQGQTKEKLSSADATRMVETVMKDRFDLWLSGNPAAAKTLLEAVAERAEERLRARAARETARKSATKRLRLPGKLADCSRQSADGTELFLVEGDSAGGSAKQARNRETQAILPLRGKILNVASASADKLKGNQELADLTLALGTGIGRDFNLDALRYERVIIMTDADVDGAHIASLLMTFFFRQMPALIDAGRLFLAMPPLYRLAAKGEVHYARDDAHKDALIKERFSKVAKIDLSRFKGLGEMPPAQLKETTMDPGKRSLLRVAIPHNGATLPSLEEDEAAIDTEDLVERLMGRNAEARFKFIQENATFIEALDI